MRRSGQAARACQAASTSPGPHALCSTAVAPQGPFGSPPHRSASSPRHTWHQAWYGASRVDGEQSHSRGFAAQAAAATAGGARQQRDPFTLVSDELDAVSARMRAAVVSEVRCGWLCVAVARSVEATGRLSCGQQGLAHVFTSVSRACAICDSAVLLGLCRCRRWRRRRSISSRKGPSGSASAPQCCCSLPPPWPRTARRAHTCALWTTRRRGRRPQARCFCFSRVEVALFQR